MPHGEFSEDTPKPGPCGVPALFFGGPSGLSMALETTPVFGESDHGDTSRGALANHRCVGQFVVPGGVRGAWKVPDEAGRNCLDGLHEALFVLQLAKARGHERNDIAPFVRCHMAGEAPVGHDLYRVLGQQQVDQHAVVVLGVPHAVFAKQHDGAFARTRMPAQVTPGQAGFGDDADLARVLPFAGGHLRGEALQGLTRQRTARLGLAPPVAHQAPKCSR